MQASTSEAEDTVSEITVNTDAKKSKYNVTKGKENFVWTDTEVELLLSITQEYKTRKTNEGVYWDSCKNKYSELNEMFVEKLMLVDQTKGEYPHEVVEFQQNPARLSRKIKQLRNKYATAVRAGKKSGGGRQVFKFYDLCQDVFGGNAAAEQIPGGIETNHHGPEPISGTMVNQENVEPSQQENTILDSDENCSGDELFVPAKAQPTKRRHLITDLRSQKLKKKITTDQQMINIAQKELVLQEKMISKISEGEIQQAKAIKSLSESVNSIGHSLSEGFRSIAAVMGRSHGAVSYNHRAMSPGFHVAHQNNPKLFDPSMPIDNEDFL